MTIMHTANAMVCQMVAAIFERVLSELETKPRGNVNFVWKFKMMFFFMWNFR